MARGRGRGRGSNGLKVSTAAFDADKARTKQLLEKRMLCGLTNGAHLALGFGLSETTIHRMMHEIREQWKTSRPEENEIERISRIRQFDNIAHQAFIEFEKSKNASEECTITERACAACHGTGTDLKKKTAEPEECDICGGQGLEEYLPSKYKRCETCHGSGCKVEGPKCQECHGRGLITFHVTKVKGQCGDPAYLALAKDAFKEAARLEGLYPKASSVAAVVNVGGELGQRATNMFIEGPEELIIQALAVMDRLNHSLDSGESKRIIEVEANQGDGNGNH